MKPKTAIQTKQGGYSFIEIGIGISVAAILLVSGIQAGVGYFAEVTLNKATNEGSKIVAAMRVYQANTGSYAGMSMTVLSENGYGVEPFSDGAGENAYGLDVDVDPAASNQDGAMVFSTDTAAHCLQFVSRIRNLDGVKSASCATANATVTTE